MPLHSELDEVGAPVVEPKDDRNAGVPGATPAQVHISGLTKTFHRNKESVNVLQDINLDVPEGELLVLLGPSGCGKTTLLRCIVGLERPNSGNIALGDNLVVDSRAGRFVQPNRRDVSMVFQNYALWPHMKVSQNVAYPLKARKLKGLLDGGRVEEMLSLVQCGHLADRYPPELSGGQQQRVSLARALAPNPALLLMDEPLSNLDALLRKELQAQLRYFHRTLGFTAVYVTHDHDEALALGTRIAVMKEGRFEQIDTPEAVFRRPATVYVADFLGARNRFDLTVDDQGDAFIASGDGSADIVIRQFFKPGMGGTFTLLFRDQDLKLRHVGDEAENSDRRWIGGGIVREVLPGGDHAEHVVRLSGIQLFIGVPRAETPIAPDSEVEIGITPSHTLCFDENDELVEDWANGD